MDREVVGGEFTGKSKNTFLNIILFQSKNEAVNILQKENDALRRKVS